MANLSRQDKTRRERDERERERELKLTLLLPGDVQCSAARVAQLDSLDQLPHLEEEVTLEEAPEEYLSISHQLMQELPDLRQHSLLVDSSN